MNLNTLILKPQVKISPHEDGYLVQNGENYFLLSLKLGKILGLFNGEHTLKELAASASNGQAHPVTIKDMEHIVEKYFLKKGLFLGEREAVPKTFLSIKFLFLPAGLVNGLAGLLRRLFSPIIFPALFAGSAMILSYYLYLKMISNGSFGQLLLALRNMPSSKLTVLYLFSALISMAHELGHASGLAYNHKSSRGIGLGVYLFIPVFFTDVSPAWELPKKDRLKVNLGGVYFQLLWPAFFIAVCYLLGLKGLLSSPIIILTAFLTTMSAINNLLPMLRFDGYWMAADYFGIPNLRKLEHAWLSGFFSWLLGKKRELECDLPFSKLDAKNKILLGAYLVFSFGFFIYFFLLALLIGFDYLCHYPEMLINLWQTISANITALDLFSLAGVIFDALVKTLVIISISMVLIKIITEILKFFKEILVVILILGLAFAPKASFAAETQDSLLPISFAYPVGYLFPKMTDFNQINGNIGNFDSIPYNGYTFRYALSPRLEVEYSNISGSARRSKKFESNDVKNGALSLAGQQVNLELKSKKLANQALTLIFSGGISYYSADYSSEETPSAGYTSIRRWEGQSWGGQAGIGLEYELLKYLALRGDFFYTLAKIGSLYEGGVADNSFPDIDLSGTLVRLELRLGI